MNHNCATPEAGSGALPANSSGDAFIIKETWTITP